MRSNLYRLGRYAARRPWVVIGAWLVVAALVIAASGAFGKKLEESFGAPGVDSQFATDLLSAAGADQAGLTAQVVMTPRDSTSTLDSPDLRTALTRIQSAAASLPHVLSAGDPVISPDGRVGLIRLQYPVLEKLEPSDLEQLKTLAAVDSPLRIELGGDLFYAFEQGQAGLGEAVGLIAAMVILLLAFGSIIAMGLPIGMAVFGLALAISSLSLVTYLIDLPSWAPVLGSMIGLGVGIDYALIIVTRHREYLARGMSVAESVGTAVATAGQAVLFAGGTVVIAILGLVVAGVPFITAGGIAVSLIVLTMVLASITLLPAFLGLAGHWINRLRVRRVRPSPGSGWQRWAGHVSKHAAAYAVSATVLLLALAAPVLALRVGTPDDGALPVQRTERRAYDLVAAGFGAGSNGPLVVAVDISRDPGVVQPLFDAVRADQGIASVAPPAVNTAAGVATLIAVPTTGPQDDATMTTVKRLRAEVFPSVLRHSPAKAHVGGQTATLADVGARVNDRLPWFIGAVVLLSVLLLTVVFRSVVVPLKAALMNLLSIGASFGVIVMIFQWGWAADLIGLDSTIPILPFIPMFMFAVVFGLSMDYEVFLLTRIREEYVRTQDNTASTIHGITTTGRVITSAALIMIAVFVSFSLADDPTAKMFGLGLATAVLVDATVVRLILVPALMKLLGDANWWTPAWFNRRLPWTNARTANAGTAVELAGEPSALRDRP
ncbi:MMPL family transporter [Kribbella sp. NPDC050124]|uniref:MMPL family transporter n=1 Tax=Kribbella sp. NPDC050124 TaxID=3364114 RepID=UPI0037ABB691